MKTPSPERECIRCHKKKSLDEYGKASRFPDGKSRTCKKCDRDAQLVNNCSDCGKKIARKSVRCNTCRGIATRGELSPYWQGGYTNEDGYRIVQAQGHPNARKSGSILEHILVMSSHLNRALLPHENVHHKNGIRDDNRIDNLELWSKSQPPGQRVDDKIAWAIQFLGEQGYEVTKNV